MRDSQWSRYGAIAKLLPFTPGKIFFVFNSSDTGYSDFVHAFPPDGDGEVRVYDSLETAYDAADSNRNDVIILNGHNTHTVAAQIAWSKNRIRVYGLDWLLGDRRKVQQSSKIAFALGTEAISAPIKVTGVRNTFRGIKFMQNSTNAAALYSHIFAGEGSLYEDCSFIFEVADNLDLTTATEALMGEDAGTFINCSFGTDVLLGSAARAVMTLDNVTGASSSDGAKSNRFIDCEWLISSSSASANMVKLADTAGAKFLNIFVRPTFAATINASGGAITLDDAFASASGYVEGNFLVIDPHTNCTKLGDTVTDNVKVIGPAPSSTTGIGTTPA